MQLVTELPHLLIISIRINSMDGYQAITHFERDVQRFHDTRGFCAGKAEAILDHP